MYQVSNQLAKEELDSLYSRLEQAQAKELYVSFISSLNGLTTDGMHLYISLGVGKIMVTGEVVFRVETVTGRWSWEKRSKKIKELAFHTKPIELSAFLYNRLKLETHLGSTYSIDYFLTKVGLDQALGVERSYKRYTSELNRLKKKHQKHLDAQNAHAREVSQTYRSIWDLPNQFPDLVERKLV